MEMEENSYEATMDRTIGRALREHIDICPDASDGVQSECSITRLFCMLTNDIEDQLADHRAPGTQFGTADSKYMAHVADEFIRRTQRDA